MIKCALFKQFSSLEYIDNFVARDGDGGVLVSLLNFLSGICVSLRGIGGICVLRNVGLFNFLFF